MSYNGNFWHTDAHENIPSPASLIVFVKSKTENQLIRFVIAYLEWWSLGSRDAAKMFQQTTTFSCCLLKHFLQHHETPDFVTPDLWPP